MWVSCVCNRTDHLGMLPSSNNTFFSSPKSSDRLWGPPSPLFSGYRGCYCRGWSADRKSAVHIHLMPKLRIRGAISPLPHTLLRRGAELSRGTTLSALYYNSYCDTHFTLCVISGFRRWCKRDPRSSGMLRSVDWQLPTFRDNLPSHLQGPFLDCLTHGDGTHWFSRNVGN